MTRGSGDGLIVDAGVRRGDFTLTVALAVAPGDKAFDWCGPISASFPRGAHIADLSFSGS